MNHDDVYLLCAVMLHLKGNKIAVDSLWGRVNNSNTHTADHIWAHEIENKHANRARLYSTRNRFALTLLLRVEILHAKHNYFSMV